MTEISYRVGDLRKMLKESSNEFKAVLGPNVESDNKRNNEKSYKESEKRAKDYDGGLTTPKDKPLYKKDDPNRTTLDYAPSTEPDEAYKKRVKAQAKGYTSEIEEKNGNERGGVEMDDKGKIYKQFTDANKDYNDRKEKIAKSGLTARELPDNTFKKNSLYENKHPKPKKLIFKYTNFVNEQQVLVRIPEEYKRDGQIIHMFDKSGNEYVVECVECKSTGNVETNIIKHTNEKLMNEQVERIHQLMDYSTNRTFASPTVKERISEQANFNSIMDLARNIRK